MELWKQEVDRLRQAGEEQGASQVSLIGEAVHAVQVEAEGGIKEVIQRLESISKSVEQGKASMDGRMNQVEAKINKTEEAIKNQQDQSKDARKSEYWKPIMENTGIENMKSVAESGKDYRIWNQKLKNNFDQIRPKAREILTWLEKIPDAKLTTEEHGKRKRLEVIKEMFDKDLEAQRTATGTINEEEKLDSEMQGKLGSMNRDRKSVV